MAQDPPASPEREEQLIYNRRPRRKSRAALEHEQALADWFGVGSVLEETRNIQHLEALISEAVANLPLHEPASDPEVLRQGWKAAAGDFISSHAELISIVKGVATIQVLQPAIRFHLKQWEPALLEKLRAQFGRDTIKSIRLIFG